MKIEYKTCPKHGHSISNQRCKECMVVNDIEKLRTELEQTKTELAKWKDCGEFIRGKIQELEKINQMRR